MSAAPRDDVPLLPAALIADARSAWPGVVVADDTLAAYVAERAAGTPPAALRVVDLYLACGCAHGDDRAIATFDRVFLAPLAAVVVRSGAPAHVGAEVVQSLRTRLLVGDDRRPPGITEYGGRSGLARWLRVSAAREASKVKRHEAFHDRLRPDEPPPPMTPEEASIRARYGSVLNEAFRDAFRELTAEERLMLRLHFADGMNLDRLATTLGFSRATAGRRVLSARTRLRDEVMKLVGERLEASREEVESVLGVLRSQLDLTLGALVSAA